MKNISSFSLLICILIFSCTKKSIIEEELDSLNLFSKNFNSVDTIFYKNKKIKTLRFYKSNSNYINVNFYESGKKQSIGEVKNSQCHNEYIDWYENGERKWVRNYDLGNQIGKNIEFRENGKIEKQFDNDKNESTDYWENGNPKFKFIENVLQYYYYSNGNLMEQYDKVNSEESFVKYLSENGEIIFSGYYKGRVLFKNNEKFNGTITCYFNNGKISHFEKVVNGIPDGKFYSYYGNGILKFEGEIENKKMIYYKSFSSDGKPTE